MIKQLPLLCLFLFSEICYFMCSSYLVPSFCSAYRSPFNIFCKAKLVAMTFFSFCLSGKLYISLWQLTNFTWYSILGWKLLFFSLHWMYFATPFIPINFLLKNLLSVLWSSLLGNKFFFLLLFIFSPCLWLLNILL